MEYTLALDIGNSKISAFVWRFDHVEQKQLVYQKFNFPCAIYYNNEIYYGEEALAKGVENKQFLITNLKCLLGCKYSDPYVNSIKDIIPFKIEKGEDDKILIEVYEDNKVTSKEPLDLLLMIVKHVVELVKSLQEPEDQLKIKYLVLAYPMSFSFHQKQDLMLIASLTDIQHIQLYPESLALCACYNNILPKSDKGIVHVDCGASGCNISLLKYSEDHFLITDYEYKNWVSGNGIIQILVDSIKERIKNNNRGYSPKDSYDIFQVVEKAIKQLNNEDYVGIDINGLILPQEQVNDLYREWNSKICRMMQKLIQRNKIEVKQILLTGKGVKLPKLAMMIIETLGVNPIIADKSEPIGYGLLSLFEKDVKNHKDDDDCSKVENKAWYLFSKSKRIMDIPIEYFPEKLTFENCIESEELKEEEL